MKFPLPNSQLRGAVLLFSCVLALLLSYLGLRNAFAAHCLGLDTRAGYERAVRLEPANARNWYLLGRSYLYDIEQPDAARAIEALRKAVALDPYSAQALVELATAYDGEGETARARSISGRATRLSALRGCLLELRQLSAAPGRAGRGVPRNPQSRGTRTEARGRGFFSRAAGTA